MTTTAPDPVPAPSPAASTGTGEDAHHVHQLVLSRHVSGEGVLDRVAEVVNRIIGSMWVFVAISAGIVTWLFAGNALGSSTNASGATVRGFDPTPWPLLLVVLNLPQLSIMISLQVSANRAQKASDARALADHQTLIALHRLAQQQITILEGQNRVLDLLTKPKV